MTCPPVQEPPVSLTAAIERAQCWAENSLDATDRSVLDAVWWLSTHLAATARVVHPAARRSLADGRHRVLRQQARAHAILTVLLRLDRHLTGDSWSARLQTGELIAQLRELTRENALAERELLDDLQRALSPDQLSDLHGRYLKAVRQGPSRPHPHAPTNWLLRGLALRLGGDIDHVRDAMDSRHVPIPRGAG